MFRPLFLTGVVLLAAAFAGCKPSPTNNAAPTNNITWLEEGNSFEGLTIAVGFRGILDPGGEELEPILAISKDGQPVADAMVFDQFAIAGEDGTFNWEVPTVYEPSPDGKSGYYAQGKLKWPQSSNLAVRYRVVLPESGKEWKRNVILQLPPVDAK